ncbi:helicase-associated domain-containing protein [Naumannella halotolerans]|uniref:XPB/Ssl2-like helicase family protein n=1 Tax=Naumannella halotolerans TaxID=993414 RepID=A0A4R7J5L1_9ACTN|nr:helicase-associated domain-containing protein [Naumannella halotolerans]TDT32445.1 XPB/Ssl2-like helicase family protein [Naumannella halotolerans]
MRPPRTYSEALRRLDQSALVRLLELRPDLCSPPPADLAEVANRAATAASVGRALERLDAAQLMTARAIAATHGEPSIAELVELTGRDRRWLADRVGELRERGLVWGGEESLQLLREVRLALGPWPGGLAPPSTPGQRIADPEQLLAELGTDERAVVDRLAWGPPTGALRQADRTVDLASARTPVERLLARGLLRPTDTETVILPREVALAARGGFAAAEVGDGPPRAVEPAVVDPARHRRVDLAGLGAAFASIQETDGLVDELDRMNPQLLRAGGIGAADQSTLIRRLGLTSKGLLRTTALAESLGLLRAAGGRVEITSAYDSWLARPGAERWLSLVLGWRDLPHWPERDPRPLEQEPGPLDARAAELRGLFLAELISVEVGATVDWELITATVGWLRPAWQNLDLAAAAAEVAEAAEWFGLTAMGGRTGLAEVAVTGELPAELSFPEPISTVILQADLTAVAAGPLQPPVLGVLRLLADTESRGTASVYRFSADSIRRGLDRGWSAEEIIDWLGEHTETDVPQPLQYLITDAARRHGAIRIGSAGSWLRIDDPAQLALVTGHPRAGEFGVRQVAPGVIIAAADAAEMVDWLHDLGLSPAAEGMGGNRLVAPAPQRARPRTVRTRPTATPQALAEQLLATVRRGEAEEQRRRDADRLQRNLTEVAGSRVDLGWVDQQGNELQDRGLAVEVAGGRLRLRPDGGDRELSVPLARIRTVEPLATERSIH